MSAVPPVFLIDSNILLYAADVREAVKQDRALFILSSLFESRRGALTVQVLGEFFVNATRKLEPPVEYEEARRLVSDYASAFQVLPLTEGEVIKAVRAVKDYQLSYWDALIWASATSHGIPFVLTEDLQDGWHAEGVRIVNPFEQSLWLGLLGI